MAKKQPNKADAQKELERLKADIKSGTLKNAYIFYGEETYLRQQYQDIVKSSLIPAGFEEFNYHRLDGKTLTVEELTETVEAMPMMAEHTLVVVTDMDLFGLEEGQRQALTDLLSDIPPYCTLLFVYDQLEYRRNNTMKKLTAVMDSYVREVPFVQQGQQQLYKWIRKHFQATGHDIDPTVAEHLTFTCGTLMTSLATEIEKIGAYAKGQNITVADIEAVADPVLNARVFDMTNQLTNRDFDAAAQILGELLQMQTEPILILAAEGKELRRLYTARLALDYGKDRFWLKQLWSMSSDYPAKLLMTAAKRVDRDWCSEAVRRCQLLDRRMKSEAGIDRSSELKLFLMALAQK